MFGRRKPDPSHIAELEREVAALDGVVPSLEQSIQEARAEELALRRNQEWSPKAAVLLDKLHQRVRDRGVPEGTPSANYVQVFSASACSYSFKPGAILHVDDPRKIPQFVRSQ